LSVDALFEFGVAASNSVPFVFIEPLRTLGS
jgi:hypothetical protein